MGRKTIQSITINFEQQELYKIFKKLEIHGRAGFSFPDKQKQAKLARTIGMKGKPLIKKNLLYPPSLAKYYGINIVALPVDVQIVEKKLNKKSIFMFKKKF